MTIANGSQLTIQNSTTDGSEAVATVRQILLKSFIIWDDILFSGLSGSGVPAPATDETGNTTAYFIIANELHDQVVLFMPDKLDQF